MKNEQTRIKVLGGAAAVLAIIGGVLYFTNKEDDIPKVSNGIYYTGPMKSKGGSGYYGTIDGKTLEPEAGKTAASEWLKQHPELDKGGPVSGSEQTPPSSSKAEAPILQ